MLAWPQTKLKTEDVIAGEEFSIIMDVRAGPPQNNCFHTRAISGGGTRCRMTSQDDHQGSIFPSGSLKLPFVLEKIIMESFQQLHPKCQWWSHLHGLRDSTAQATVSAFTLTVGSRVA